MIRGVGTDQNGNPLVLLGLSHENLRRLPTEPIRVDTTAPFPGGQPSMVEGGAPGMTIVIFTGRDETTMAAALRKAGALPREHFG